MRAFYALTKRVVTAVISAWAPGTLPPVLGWAAVTGG